MAEYLLNKLSVDLGRGEIVLDAECIKALQAYSWPGNVRELRNVIERAVLLSEQRSIGLKDLHFDGNSRGSSTPYLDTSLTLIELERQHIERVLQEEQGRVEKAARRLGIPRSSLYQKLKKHQIQTSKV
jgi:DNA-binding NtrC family response regulator